MNYWKLRVTPRSICRVEYPNRCVSDFVILQDGQKRCVAIFVSQAIADYIRRLFDPHDKVGPEDLGELLSHRTGSKGNILEAYIYRIHNGRYWAKLVLVPDSERGEFECGQVRQLSLPCYLNAHCTLWSRCSMMDTVSTRFGMIDFKSRVFATCPLYLLMFGPLHQRQVAEVSEWSRNGVY